ncbi:DUF5666 domain-containing protein [Ktedonobacter racemifer]|uniref:DUF5666 domain-containing protein n=1 Tax=Ktedonobacter racemifer DSM 44963 TaxID=485913 RepID=D6U0P5_KTERA|nr:DUF5666 domain-containing protein [Ktedonobacter racemifer]EFH82385.1 hypothetical protein Krac_3194 [Ktedonobacter racemifer DSM 44963]
MSGQNLHKTIIGGLAGVLLCALLLSGCGSSPSQGTAASSTPTATNCTSSARFRPVSGTLKSVDGNTLSVMNRQGKSVTAHLEKTTRFTQEKAVAASDVKEGVFVSAVVKQNSDNSTYTATQIVLTDGNSGAFRNNRQQRGNNPNANCAPARQRTPTGNGNGNGGVRTNANGTHTLSGTVGQLNNNILTVTDTKGDDYTINLASTTNIMQISSATVSDLKAGETVTVTGSTEKDGSVDAQNIAILPAGSNSQSPAGN